MITVRHLGLCDYADIWQRMRDYTDARNAYSDDEIWLLQHHPVLTQGLRGKAEHVLPDNTLPIVQSDRGGQITYHGPGQLIAYLLIDLKRHQLNIRSLVSCLEDAVIDVLASYDIAAYADCKAPGVYVEKAKICSLGLRVRKGYSYHGLSFNVAMDLKPFSYIHPCGFKDLAVTQLTDLVPHVSLDKVRTQLTQALLQRLPCHA